MIVFISSPYTAEYKWEILENVEKAMDIAIELIKLGHTPIIPHLNYFLDEKAKEKGINFTYEDWMNYCLKMLDVADAILYLGYSNGTNRELKKAIEKNILIFFSVDEIKRYSEECFNEN